MGWVVSLQLQAVGLIPSLAQQVKGSGIAIAAAQVATATEMGSLAQELHMPWGSQKKEKRNKLLGPAHTQGEGNHTGMNVKRQDHWHHIEGCIPEYVHIKGYIVSIILCEF